MKKIYSFTAGQTLIEILLALALTAILLPALLTGLIATTGGKPQESQRAQALGLLKESEEVIRSIRERDWSSFASTGTFHASTSANMWTLVSGAESVNGMTRTIAVNDVYRDINGVVVSSGGTLDPSTKRIDIAVTWGIPYLSTANSSMYITRYLNNTVSQQTSQAQFNGGTAQNTQVTNTTGGEILLALNSKAKWCSPSLSSATIDLPDGPPVAVVATASAVSVSIPNDVFVATAPYATSSDKLAYLNVSANTDPPVPSLKGIFTLDASKYSAPGLFPTGINLDNSFITNSVAYYKSAAGKLYALLATTKPDHEVIAIQITSNSTDSYQDPVNKIYKYWTFFNTRIYQGNSASTPNQDESPYGYGGSSIAVLGTRGYMASGGFLYVFDLSNIDSKSTSNGLDMIGCRIEMDGYDCNPATSKIRKYSSGNTGTNFAAEQSGQTGCMDGGAVSRYGNNDIYPIQVANSTYVFSAVGAGADPEFNIANVSSIPTNSTSPRINNSSCGTIASGNASWKRVSSLDFNSDSGTQETANSIYAKSDGTRAYISSNGGVDADGDSHPDSDQFYVINTSNKTAPKFLTGNSSTGAQSGYYNGDSTNIQQFPRRSLTVLNGQRVVLVGQDGFPNDAIEPKEYQVLNLDTEATPNYCGGVNYLPGFNDLTSVIEADTDTFVYMVANTNEKQLKIIQGGPDGTYLISGTFESSTIDIGSEVAFNRLITNTTLPAGTDITFQVAISDAISGSCSGVTFNYVGPDGTSGTYFPATGGIIALNNDGSGYENPGRCARYKAFLTTLDSNSTPQLLDVSINYSL